MLTVKIAKNYIWHQNISQHFFIKSNVRNIFPSIQNDIHCFGQVRGCIIFSKFKKRRCQLKGAKMWVFLKKIQNFWSNICLKSSFEKSKTLKVAKMCLNFQMITLEKYLTQNFEILFRGYPLFGPSKSSVSKNDHPALPLTPLFYCRILFHTKNVDVCKKLELNPLRFDRDIRGLSLTKRFSKNFIFSPCEQKTP